jgi:hypothetical protein
MSRIYNSLIKFFEEDKWYFSPVVDKPSLQMAYEGENGQWTCYAHSKEELEQFVFYSLCPIKAPKSKLLKMAEFLTRANYGLIIGNFEMDFEDGEIRFKTSIDVENTDLNSALIKPIVYANIFTMDRYLPGIMTVVSGALSPKQAVEQIEEEA